MHAYLATICRDLGAELVHLGGVADHVHIVTTLPRTVSQAEFIEQMKKTSSKWIKAFDGQYRGFFWQRGYGAFSVSPSQFDAVLNYVKAQQWHHRTCTFQEEYRDMLRKPPALKARFTFGNVSFPSLGRPTAGGAGISAPNAFGDCSQRVEESPRRPFHLAGTSRWIGFSLGAPQL